MSVQPNLTSKPYTGLNGWGTKPSKGEPGGPKRTLLSREARMRALLERWLESCAPGATGNEVEIDELVRDTTHLLGE
jgi:hypothetical protein